MKSLIASLLLLTAIGANASTDTVKVPVEQKVIELHMVGMVTPAVDEMKRNRKVETLPFVRKGTCSGSFINANGDIITAGHCVEGFELFEAVTYDQRKYRAIVVATSSIHDLAILHIDRRDTPYFELAKSISRGETISILGSPLGITDTLSTGVVARLDGDITMIDCGALPGNSGGPIYNKDEQMVGVLTAGMVVFFGTTHLNISQGLDAISFFIENAIKK